MAARRLSSYHKMGSNDLSKPWAAGMSLSLVQGLKCCTAGKDQSSAKLFPKSALFLGRLKNVLTAEMFTEKSNDCAIRQEYLKYVWI
jgi:hypothetical protein